MDLDGGTTGYLADTEKIKFRFVANGAEATTATLSMGLYVTTSADKPFGKRRSEASTLIRIAPDNNPVLFLKEKVITMNSPIREGYDVSTGIFISGMNLTHDVTVEAEPGVIITPESITVDKVNASEDGVRVGVRFTPELGTASKVVTVKSAGAEPVTATIKYTVKALTKPEFTAAIFTDEDLTQSFEGADLIPGQDYYLKLSIQVNDYANRRVNISAMAKNCNLAFATNPGGEFKVLALDGGKFTTDNFMLQIGGVATKDVVFRITPNAVEKDTYIKATFNLNCEDQQIETVSKELNIKFVPEAVAAADAMSENGKLVTATFSPVDGTSKSFTLKSDGAADVTVIVNYTVKPNTGVEEILSTTKIWGENGIICIDADSETTARIYTVQGQLVESFNLL